MHIRDTIRRIREDSVHSHTPIMATKNTDAPAEPIPTDIYLSCRSPPKTTPASDEG
jgi:hypothetical protein